jgi:starch phosphorylase
MADTPLVAYFSMEIGLNTFMPTYAGGLGVLAGDTIRSAADLEIPLVAVSLLHRHGYFYQRLDAQGRQTQEAVAWPVDDFLEAQEPRASVEVEGRTVQLRAWRYLVRGQSGFTVPVYFLDTDLPENAPEDRALTGTLYGGDQAYRLRQEAVLGLGGTRLLRAFKYGGIARFHLNEGHAALLALALLEEHLATTDAAAVTAEAMAAVREQCIFTTHTPVPAGHDQFPAELARRVLGERRWAWLRAFGQEEKLNLTDLALRCSRFINGVSMEHGEISRGLFPGYPVHSITNGVHAVTWAAPSFQTLYDRHLPDWRRDALSLRNAIGIPGAEIWQAHRAAKLALVEYVNRETNAGFDRDVLTIGFARRATAYKRSALIFHDLERLKAIAARAGRLQLVFAGKAHPQDHQGQELIRRVHQMGEALRGHLPVAYLANHDMALAKMLCAGADVWLNTPLPPMEASGTSGMKAALNGVPSLSVLDGWWIEGHIEGVTGWAIENGVTEHLADRAALDARHAASLYDKLERVVLPCFYHDPERFIRVMRSAIALNGAFFNTHRMLAQYLLNAYRLVGQYLGCACPE